MIYLITIYLIGVIIFYFMIRNPVRKELYPNKNEKITYGDLFVLIGIYSLSWIGILFRSVYLLINYLDSKEAPKWLQ